MHKCENPTCNNHTPMHKKYCCDKCRFTAQNIRRGTGTGLGFYDKNIATWSLEKLMHRKERLEGELKLINDEILNSLPH